MFDEEGVSVEEALFCPSCRLRQPVSHRFCLRCGKRLPRYLMRSEQGAEAKTLRIFAALRVTENDPEHAYLRVSCYKKDQTFEAPEGAVTVPGHHVRFSIWSVDRAICALSLPEVEARELAEYLISELDGLTVELTTGD